MGDDIKLIKDGKLSECPYGKGHLRRIFIITTDKKLRSRTELIRHGEALHSAFLPAGLMAAPGMVYGHNCVACRACVPLRVAVKDYPFSKSEKRILKNNADLIIDVRDTGHLNTEHYDLFRKYRDTRHPNTSLKTWQHDDFFQDSGLHSGFMEIRSPASRLLAFTVYDSLPKGVNCYSNFFDAQASSSKRSLGIFSILIMIRLAQAANDSHVYLGSWVQGNKTLDYKKRFKNLETLINGNWVPFDPVKHTFGPDNTKAIPPDLLP